MEVVTNIKVNFETDISDSWDDDEKPTNGEILESVETHIDDWCKEHNIDKSFIEYKINYDFFN